jgi:hypothetical protein
MCTQCLHIACTAAAGRCSREVLHGSFRLQAELETTRKPCRNCGRFGGYPPGRHNAPLPLCATRGCPANHRFLLVHGMVARARENPPLAAKPLRFFRVRWRLNRVDLGLCGGITSWIRGKREIVGFRAKRAQIFRLAKNSTFSNLPLNSAKDAPLYCLTDLALLPANEGLPVRHLSQNGFCRRTVSHDTHQ